MISSLLAQFNPFFALVPTGSVSLLVPAWFPFSRATRVHQSARLGNKYQALFHPQYFSNFKFFSSFKCRERVVRLFLSYSPTKWTFCAMAPNLAVTAKVTNSGRKGSQALRLGKQRLLWCCSVQKSKRNENEQNKAPAAAHTTQHLPFSVLSLAPATAKPAKQDWNLPRKQLLELPRASAARGSGV